MRCAEPALDDGARDEEGDDDQQDGAVGEPRVRLLGRQRAREHGGGDRQQRRRENGKRADDDGHDGRGEEREQMPGLRSVSPSGTGENQTAQRERASRGRAVRAVAAAPTPPVDRRPVSSCRTSLAGHGRRIEHLGDLLPR